MTPAEAMEKFNFAQSRHREILERKAMKFSAHIFSRIKRWKNISSIQRGLEHFRTGTPKFRKFARIGTKYSYILPIDYSVSTDNEKELREYLVAYYVFVLIEAKVFDPPAIATFSNTLREKIISLGNELQRSGWFKEFNIPRTTISELEPSITAHAQEVIIEKAREITLEATSEFRRDYQALLKNHEEQLGREFTKVLNLQNRMQEVQIDLENARSELKDSAEKFGHNSKDLLGLNNKFSEAVARAEEFAKYKQLDGYFEEKDQKANRAFYWWLVGFAVILFFSAAIAFENRKAIFADLPVLQTGNYEIGKSIVFVLPIIAIIWMLRMCVRFATHHLRIKEDANNRMIMIRTLAAMEDENENSLTEAERAIALNAIFRSSMAENSDLDVGAPNVVELISAYKKSKD